MYNDDLLDSIPVDKKTEEYERYRLKAINNLTDSEISESAKYILTNDDNELPEERVARRKTANNLIEEMLKIINHK